MHIAMETVCELLVVGCDNSQRWRWTKPVIWYHPGGWENFSRAMYTASKMNTITFLLHSFFVALSLPLFTIQNSFLPFSAAAYCWRTPVQRKCNILLSKLFLLAAMHDRKEDNDTAYMGVCILSNTFKKPGSSNF